MINSTKIRARAPGKDAVPYEATVEALSILSEGGVPFESPVWTGVKELWCPAESKLIKQVSRLVALEIEGQKYRISLDGRFLIIRTKATRDREDETYPANEALAWIKASDMRIGDRLYFPAFDNIRKDWNKQDKHTGLGFIAVNRLRIQDLDEAVDMYGLSVARYRSVWMPQGIILAA
jgi:hypothetical protein